jgi:hypothetical protein
MAILISLEAGGAWESQLTVGISIMPCPTMATATAHPAAQTMTEWGVSLKNETVRSKRVFSKTVSAAAPLRGLAGSPHDRLRLSGSDGKPVGADGIRRHHISPVISNTSSGSSSGCACQSRRWTRSVCRLAADQRSGMVCQWCRPAALVCSRRRQCGACAV